MTTSMSSGCDHRRRSRQCHGYGRGGTNTSECHSARNGLRIPHFSHNRSSNRATKVQNCCGNAGGWKFSPPSISVGVWNAALSMYRTHLFECSHSIIVFFLHPDISGFTHRGLDVDVLCIHPHLMQVGDTSFARDILGWGEAQHKGNMR